ncbi:non-canonical purine NTP pyrophosphatase [Streptomyces sp. NPDC091377]|uniref:non-canonical purine NTP pyrophosphatase n=1 Tax=Streptomyces sp. NPDC091377 TaxID=3365995 RepID=UPI0037F8F4EB
MLRVVLATANPAKAAEITVLLGSALDLLPRPLWLPDTPEDGRTIEENAWAKAAAVVAATGLPAVADDTVLEVDALGGAPGLRSGRYAGEHAGEAANTDRLLRELAGVPERLRGAWVRTVAVLGFPDGTRLVGVGAARGTVTRQRRGATGFGYDAVFAPDEGDGRTLAEMSAEEKARYYCRGRAFRDLLACLSDRGPAEDRRRTAR